ncbi:UNVERIFIED_CONTAM: hypothetical protein HDU68_009465 [Siphonaria sp. JEL0065]|nr:hypothetical protein HDU68_009465 [Siphonaria sp. JEL0065]
MPLKIVVVGTGLGGAALALALKQFDLVEAVLQAGGPINLDFGDVGAGLVIQANGLRVLKRLNVLDQVIAAGFSETDKFTNSPKPTPPHLDEGVSRTWRQDFTGKKLMALRQTKTGVTCQFADGSVTGDILVGADGMHSMTRRLTFGEDKKAEFTGIIGLWS